MKNRTDKLAKAFEFQEAANAYESVAARSPRSLSVHVHRAVLASLARNESQGYWAAQNLTAKFPRSGIARAYLGVIEFCNCRFRESGVLMARADFLRRDLESEEMERLINGKHPDVFAESLGKAERLIHARLWNNATATLEPLLERGQLICWKGSPLLDRLFLLHTKLLRSVPEDNSVILEYLSKYIHKSPKLAKLYTQRAWVHAQNGDVDASQADLEMAQRVAHRVENSGGCCGEKEDL
jgi:hypothetical protein